MEYTIHIGDQPITLFHDNFDSMINVDDLTKIDTSNLFGEAVTISAAANRVGLLKAEVEVRLADQKLDLKIYESQCRSKARKEAGSNGGYYNIRVDNEDVKVKLTEKALESIFEEDSRWIEMRRDYNKLERNLSALTSLHWSIQDKCRKLNGLVSGTTPEDFVEGMIEGKVNGILISKKKRK